MADDVLDIEEAPAEVNDPSMDAAFDSLSSGGETPPVSAPAVKTDSPAEPAGPLSPDGGDGAQPPPDAAAPPSSSPAKPAEDQPPSSQPGPGGPHPSEPPSTPVPVDSSFDGYDLSKIDPAQLAEDLAHDLADVELADDTVDGGKVKLGDMMKDSSSFMQAAAVIAAAAVQKALAPYRAMVPAMQEQAQTVAKERILTGLEQEGIADARTLVTDDKFWGWVDQQPKEIQAAADSTNQKSVARVMKLYRMESGTQPAPAASPVDPAKQQAAADALKKTKGLHAGVETTRSGGAPTSATPATSVEDEFKDLKDE